MSTCVTHVRKVASGLFKVSDPPPFAEIGSNQRGGSIKSLARGPIFGAVKNASDDATEAPKWRKFFALRAPTPKWTPLTFLPIEIDTFWTSMPKFSWRAKRAENFGYPQISDRPQSRFWAPEYKGGQSRRGGSLTWNNPDTSSMFLSAWLAVFFLRFGEIIELFSAAFGGRIYRILIIEFFRSGEIL